MMKGRNFLSLIFFASALLLSSVTVAQPTAGDLLLYDDTEREPPGITAYNPATGEKLELPVTVSVEAISTSGDGLIAYIQDNDIWVLDVLNAPNSPVNITQIPDEQESLWGWTPDGKLLQFQVGSEPGPYILYIYDGDEIFAVDYGYSVERYWNKQGWYAARHNGSTDAVSWYVWNGQERIDLALPTLTAEPIWHTFLWTPNNHLFITVGYNTFGYGQLDRMSPIGPTDIFYWNGDSIREVERPSDDETFMLGDWSADGRLTLYTSQDLFDRWYIWDGVSFTHEGMPDTLSLIPINSVSEEIRDIEWMPDGRLAIVAASRPEPDSLLRYEVYLWDSQSVQQVTSTDSGSFWVDVHDSGSIAVSDTDGLRGYGVTVYDTDLQPVFDAGGKHFHSRWSADGSLAYCPGDALFVWNGQDTTQLSSRTFAKWLIAPSPSMLCSTG